MCTRAMTKILVIFRSVFSFGRFRTSIQVGSTGFFSLCHIYICPQSFQPLSFSSVPNLISQIICPLAVCEGSVRCFEVKARTTSSINGRLSWRQCTIFLFLPLLSLPPISGGYMTCMEAKLGMWWYVKKYHQVQICEHYLFSDIIYVNFISGFILLSAFPSLQ